MAKDWIFLAVVTVAAALAAFNVGGIKAADLNEEELGVLNHKGESFFSEKHIERNHDKDADADTTNHWHQDERVKRRRAMRKSKRWTDENKQNRRRIYSQDTMKRSRRRRDDVHSEDYERKMKNYMKGDKRRHERSFTTRRRQDSPDAGRGTRGHRHSRESPDGRRRNTKKSRKDAQNRRREFPNNLHKKKSSERRRINKNLDNSNGGIGKRTKLKEHKEKPGKGGKLAEKKPKAMTEEVKKKKIHSVPKGGKSTTSKRKKAVEKMKIILGKGGKKASPKGSCKVSKVVPSDDGNSAILFGYNMEKRGGCKMTFKGPKGSTLSLDCPQFQLNSEGCSQEGMEVYDKESKEKTEHCQTSGPKGWKSSGNVAVITFLREPSKGNCGRNFVCQISVTGSPQNVKMLGEQEDCGESFDLASGESAVIHSINGPGKRECKINIKAPKGTYLNITCPLISLDGKYCGEEVVLEDEGFDTYGYSFACQGDKALSLVTETHMASIFHKREKDKKKVFCSAGFVCVASVVVTGQEASSLSL
ncbi:arginine/serine-rich protein PNISR-like [Palaemon carinicauda]|uniref:arginine/serine-rich protein PNISR-like n=1 Tax=Palaemon carinicauda TaxID=392227 RepID=UPI0035B57268